MVRREEEYALLSLAERNAILNRFVVFLKNVPVKCVVFIIEKKYCSNKIELAGQISKKLSAFLKDHLEELQGYDSVKIYYDNSQHELSVILSSVFNAWLSNVEFKKTVKPSDYRLFQIADFICTLENVQQKLESGTLSKSEQIFFKDRRTFKKNFYKYFDKKNDGNKENLESFSVFWQF